MSNEPKADRPQMPDYGIEQGPAGMLPWSWAAERLARSRNYWVATTRPDRRPHAMAVWGLWLDDAFMFISAPTSRKRATWRAVRTSSSRRRAPTRP